MECDLVWLSSISNVGMTRREVQGKLYRKAHLGRDDITGPGNFTTRS